MRILQLVSLVILGGCQAKAQNWDEGKTWAFEPKRDDFRKDALLDLRFLNEKTAGESGFVTTDGLGGFKLGGGRPVRFWAVNSNVGRDVPFTAAPLGRQTEPILADHAKFLAKRGVNMIRLHSQITPSPGQSLTDINTKERDWIWRSVAAMRKEGIYTTISPYWSVPMKFAKEWGIPGDAGQSALGLLFIDAKLQSAYRTWLTKLLQETNPYTGIPLAKDPAVAIIQLQNEDSLLFWTVNAIQGQQRANLSAHFGQWLIAKYGSATNIGKHWENDKLPADKPEEASYDFHNVWEMTQARVSGRAKRLDDQTEFWATLMYDFNKNTSDFLHKTLGCKQMINAGNWKTADGVRLNDIERWTYTPTDVDAVNKYYSGIHKGPNEGWAIVPGDTFTSPSCLLDPKPLPTNLKQTKGRPMMVTESSWVMPTGYASEGPFLTAAYQSLTGVDIFYWFATGDDEWTAPESGNGYLPSQAKWVMGNPDMLGTFPGAALMFRQGYVKQGDPVVVEERALSDLWQRKTPIIAEEASFDPNRDSGDIAAKSAVRAGVNPLAFLIGPVQVEFGGDPAKTQATSLTKNINSGDVSITSNTGEIMMNNLKAFCTVDSPCAQGVAAFFDRKPAHKLSDVTFISRNEYGASLAVSMDTKPLKESKKILVQFGTRCRPTGWREKEAPVKLEGGGTVSGFEVISSGKAPWRVVNADLEVIVNNPNLTSATALDANGNSVGSLAVSNVGGKFRFKFPSNCLYVVLQ